MRLKRTTKQLIIAVTIGVVVVGIAFAISLYIISGQMKDNYQKQIDEANQLISVNQKNVYVAKEEIPAQETITEDKLQYINVFTGLSDEAYITKDDFGKMAVVDIPAKVPVQKNMITSSTVASDVREEEFNVFYLSSNLKENDYIDVRIIFPNGEDYSVLSKKSVKDLSLENGNCFLWLTAEEILRISGAIVDSYLHDGTKLYTVKYVEPLAQDGTEITYLPNEDVINLIRNDPNIVKLASESLNEEIRRSLDDRLSTFYQSYNGQVSWDNVAPKVSQVTGQENATESDFITPVPETNENTDEEEGVYYVE